MKGRRCIDLYWDETDGYIVTPTEKRPKEGYIYMEDHVINLGKEFEPGQLAKALREAMALSKA